MCANIVATGDDSENIPHIKKIIKKHCSLKLEKYKVPMRIHIVKQIQNSRFKRVRREINDN